MNDYDKAMQHSDGMNEVSDCAVLAVTLVSGRSYRSVHQIFQECGRVHREGTPFSITKKVLKRLGLKIRWIDRPAKTVLTLERCLPPGRFLIRVHRHIVAVVDGKIHDWTSGKRYRIKEFYEVTG